MVGDEEGDGVDVGQDGLVVLVFLGCPQQGVEVEDGVV